MPEIDLLMRGYTLNTDQGRWEYSMVTLIRGQSNILVDTGPHSRRDYLNQMHAAKGMSADDIDIVILSHAHWDHVQNIDLFPRARIVANPVEVEYSRAPRKGDWATATYFAATLEDHEVQQATEGMEVEPGVKVVETPGHTKGHISILVETRGGTVAISADALPGAPSVFTGLPALIFWDEAEAATSVKKLLQTSRVFYPGHDRPFRVVEDSRIEYIGGEESIRIFGTLGYGQGDLSVTLAPPPPSQVFVLRE